MPLLSAQSFCQKEDHEAKYPFIHLNIQLVLMLTLLPGEPGKPGGPGLPENPRSPLAPGSPGNPLLPFGPTVASMPGLEMTCKCFMFM